MKHLVRLIKESERILVGRHLQIPPDENDRIWAIKNAIKRTELELEKETDIKKIIVLKHELANLGEALDRIK